MKKFLLLLREKAPPSFTIRHWLVICTSFSLVLLLIRIISSARYSYVFLAWNLILAYIPFLISNWLSLHREVLKYRLKLAFVIFAWILFMPNSFYIVTDLFHLDNMGYGHPWFDLTLILSFAWNGILLGLLSIRKMETLLRQAKGKFISGVVICVVMWLNAFGIYIGRFLRFNSWDVVANPFSLFGEIADIVLNPYDYRYVWAMSCCFAFFMIILYYSTKRLAEPD
jgi:uncharacterized membrane protein